MCQFRLILLSCCLFLSLTASAASKLNSVCAFSHCPTGQASDDEIVDHGILVLANNPHTKFADWVAYRVEPRYLRGPRRKRLWRADPVLPKSDTLPPSAYVGVHQQFHTDRGHQAPLGSFKGAKNYYVVNYLSNITPQASSLNEGAWEHLESAVRRYVKHSGRVYVVTGPYYSDDKSPAHILPNYLGKVLMPSGYFKVIIKTDKSRAFVSAFAFPQNTPRRAKFCSYMISVGDVKTLTHGLNVIAMKALGNLSQELGC